MECLKCGGTKFTKSGFTWRAGKRVQRWLCSKCGRIVALSVKEVVKERKSEE